MKCEAEQIRRMLDGRRIAIVGLSDDPSRPSHDIARVLLSRGKQVVPVNPNVSQVLGLECVASLSEAEGPIDVVNVFRRAEYCPDIVRAAIAVGARGVWLQSGIASPEARHLADEAGIDYVEDRCIKVELLYGG